MPFTLGRLHLRKGDGHHMKPLKAKVSITLDAEIIDAIKNLSEKDDRSFSQYINLVLKEHLKDNAAKLSPTPNASQQNGCLSKP